MRHLQIYHYIKAVAEHGSIRKASEYLTISPSALNRQILAFEAELGIAMFERLAVGVRLSAAGEIYYRRIIEHLAAFEGANETIVAMSGLQFGHIELVVSPELAGFLARQVARFRTVYPGIRVAMYEVPQDGFARWLETRRADLALIAQPVFQPGAETIISTTTDLLAVTPFDGGPIKPEAYLEHDLILPPPGTGMRIALDLVFRRLLLPLQPALVSERLLPPQSAPRPTLQFWPAADLAQPARPLVRRVPLSVVLCRAEARVLPPATDRMANWLTEALQAL